MNKLIEEYILIARGTSRDNFALKMLKDILESYERRQKTIKESYEQTSEKESEKESSKNA